jgi:hypothetical protein
MSIFDTLAGWVPDILGLGTALATNNNASAAQNRAANGATYNPTNVTTPFGSSTYSLQNGRPTYNITPGVYGNLIPQMSNLASTGFTQANKFAGMKPEDIAAMWNPQLYSQYTGANTALTGLQNTANSAAGNFGTLANAGMPGATAFEQGQGPLAGNANTLFNSSTDFLKNTDPTQIYKLLTNMAAPGETTATQSMFDKLQATGRLGLTQNGQLGDLGGLQLAQQTAQNQRMADAYGFGQQNAIAGGNLGSQLYSTGNQNMATLASLLQDKISASGVGADAAGQRFTNAGILNNAGSQDISNALNIGNAGLTGLQTTQQNMMLPMLAGNQASSAAAQAGANAAPYTVGASQGTTDLLSTIGHGILTNTGLGGKISSGVSNLLGGGAATGLQAAGASAAGDAGAGILSNLGSFGGAAAQPAGTYGGLGALGGNSTGLGAGGSLVGTGSGAAAPAAIAPTAAAPAAGTGALGSGTLSGATGGAVAGAGALADSLFAANAIGSGADAALASLAANTPALGAGTFGAAGSGAAGATGALSSFMNVAGPTAIALVGAYDLYHLLSDPHALNKTMMAADVAKGGPLGSANSSISGTGAVSLQPLTQSQLNAMITYPGSFSSPDWAKYYPDAFSLVGGKSVPKAGLGVASPAALQPTQAKVRLPNAASFVGPHG